MQVAPVSSASASLAHKVRLNKTVIASSVTAALGGLLFGFDTVVISGVNLALTRVFSLSPITLGVTVAIALWGTVVGAAMGGWMGDKYGRRMSLRFLALAFTLTALGCALAWDWYSLLVFRFIAGVAIGASSVVGPMYIAEIAPAAFRGRMVALFQLNIVFGIVVAFVSNYYIGTLGIGATEWRWKLGVSAVPAALFFLMLFRIPRSPRWLMETGKLDEARQVLAMVAEGAATEEYAAIQSSLASDRAAGNQPLLSRRYRIPVMLAISLALFNQFSGINAILYYLGNIFDAAGFSNVSGDLQSIAVGVTNFTFTIVAMTVIDKVGRKVLLLIGAVGTFVCLSATGLLFYTNQHKNLLIYTLIGFVAFFAVSQGSVIWVYLSEIFPNSVRGKGQSLGSLTHWVVAASLALVFPKVAVLSASAPFFFFAGMTLLQFFVVFKFFPETKGFTLEELQAKLETV